MAEPFTLNTLLRDIGALFGGPQVGFGTPPILPPVNPGDGPSQPGYGSYRVPGGGSRYQPPLGDPGIGGAVDNPNAPHGPIGQTQANDPHWIQGGPGSKAPAWWEAIINKVEGDVAAAAQITGVYVVLFVLFIVGVVMLFSATKGQAQSFHKSALKGAFT